MKKKRNDADEITRVLQEQKLQQEKYKPQAMEVEYPKGIQVTSNNSMKYTYHSSSNPQNYQQYSQSQPYEQNINNQPYRFNQPTYQYNNNSYANVNSNNSSGYQGNHYIPHNSGNSSGYPFTQYHHMNNNYTPHYINHDEQLLEDLPGDENIQRLF